MEERAVADDRSTGQRNLARGHTLSLPPSRLSIGRGQVPSYGKLAERPLATSQDTTKLCDPPTKLRDSCTPSLPTNSRVTKLLTKCDLLGIERGGEREKHKTDIIFYPATSTASTHPVAAQAYIRRSDERGITQPGLRFSEYAHESFRFWGGLQNGFAIPGTRGGGHHATWSKIF